MTGVPIRRLLAVGLVASVALLVWATVFGSARLGPLVVWSVHQTVDATGSTVALRPGLGLAALWLAIAALAAISLARPR